MNHTSAVKELIKLNQQRFDRWLKTGAGGEEANDLAIEVIKLCSENCIYFVDVDLQEITSWIMEGETKSINLELDQWQISSICQALDDRMNYLADADDEDEDDVRDQLKLLTAIKAKLEG